MIQSCSVKPPEQRQPPPARPPEETAVAPQPPSAPRSEEVAPTAFVGLPMLRADGARIVDPRGQPVALKGCNLGNWLLLEMWMLDVADVRDQYEFESILAQRFGAAEKDRLMELYRAHYITARDFPIVRSFGFNCVRLPFNYRLLADEAAPAELKPDAFRWLDQAIEWARTNRLYVILDMHGAPGGQSVDHTTGRAGQNHLWTNETCKELTVRLWTAIAERYRDNGTVAAYDVINEPFGDYKTPAHLPALSNLFDRIYAGIRAVDTNHLVIAPGTHQGIEFYGMPRDRGWQNVGFTEHYYPGLFGSDPVLESHSEFIFRQIPWRAAYLRKAEAPFLVGEFNVVFQRLGGGALMRTYYDVYAKHGWAATMWAYKIMTKDGGPHEDSWCMVKNKDPKPPFQPRVSSKEEIESFFRWLGTTEYSYHQNLGAAMTMKEPPPVVLPKMPNMPVEPPAQDPPGAWQTSNIGGALPGGQKVGSDTAMDIYGGGDDIWGKSDSFRFVWQRADGDFEFTATLNSIGYSHEFAKAGLMVRASLDPDAPHFLVNVFPDGRVVLAWRPEKGADTDQKILKVVDLPVHLRLTRRGNFLDVLYSTDGQDWAKTQVHMSAALGHSCLVGFAVLSQDSRCLTTASFSNIQFAVGPLAR
jgi:endoglucanase